jgi:myo-inositol 2-dehydrogenase/D-chiro-inositol 1-dehydrogenase
MTEIVRVGVIGAGRIGKLHAQNLVFHVPNAEVSAISDVAVESARQCAAACHIPKAVKDHREILEDAEIDAIYVCSSTDTHAQMIIEGAQAGKDIFCEKPIDYNLKRIDEALQAVETAGIKLQIGFNRRFDPSFKNAREMIVAGKIGVPHIVRITSRDSEAPPVSYIKVSGGLFFDMTIHDFDMCRYLLGEEVTEIYAHGTSLVDPKIGEAGDIDTAIVNLTYQSGAYCVIDNSREAVYGYDQRVEVFGSEGCIVVGNRTPHEGMLYQKAAGQQPLPIFSSLGRYDEAYVAESCQFINSIIEDTPPLVTGIDGKIPVLMGMAAKKSLDEHRPVSITEILGGEE